MIRLELSLVSRFLVPLFFYSFGCKRQPSQSFQNSLLPAIDDFAALESFILNEKPKELKDLLPVLSENIKESALLVHTSRGSQPSSFLNPRVIAFNRDASLILTFATAEKGAGHNSLKLISFDQSVNKFLFSEVRQEGIGLILNKQPKGCESCHGVSLRPNWDPYDIWPGIYGSLNSTSVLANDDPAQHAANAFERQRLEEFNSAQPQKWRSFSPTTYQIGPRVKVRFDKFSRALSILNHRKIFAEVKLAVSQESHAHWLRDAAEAPNIVANVPEFLKGNLIEKYSLSDPIVAKAQKTFQATQDKVASAIALWKEQVLQRLNGMYPALVVLESYPGRTREFASKGRERIKLEKVTVGKATQFDFSSFSETYGGFFDERTNSFNSGTQRFNYFDLIVSFVTAAEALGLKTEDWSLAALNLENDKGEMRTGGYTFSNGSGSISRLKEDSERKPGYIDPY